MGINEINDQRDSLLTQRLERLRQIQKREGEDSSGGKAFQQELFSSSEREQRENDNEMKSQVETPAEIPIIRTPQRALSPAEIEDVLKKTTEDKPGQLIDIEI